MNEQPLDHDRIAQAARHPFDREWNYIHVEIGDLRLKFTPKQFLALTDSSIDDNCPVTRMPPETGDPFIRPE